MTTKKKIERYIGFWGPGNNLPRASDFADKEFSPWIREKIIHYLNGNHETLDYMKGWSNCRICGKRNGSCSITDGEYIWPEGYSHYVEKHHIVPPPRFVRKILRKMRSKS